MIDVAINDGIAVVTMRYGKANALDIELCDTLAARFAELRGGDSKAVVLTGQGRIFSAGVDLIRVGEGGADYIRQFLPALHMRFTTRCSSIPSRWWRRSTAMPSPAARCLPLAPTAASWRAKAGASA